MSDAVTDTHALIWYLEDSPRLSPAANEMFERCDRDFWLLLKQVGLASNEVAFEFPSSQ